MIFFFFLELGGAKAPVGPQVAPTLVAPVWKLNGHPRTLIGDGWLSFKNPGPATSGHWEPCLRSCWLLDLCFFKEDRHNFYLVHGMSSKAHISFTSWKGLKAHISLHQEIWVPLHIFRTIETLPTVKILILRPQFFCSLWACCAMAMRKSRTQNPNKNEQYNSRLYKIIMHPTTEYPKLSNFTWL